VLSAKFTTFDFEGDWLDAVCKPERAGTWIVFGAPKNGKTSFTMMLAKYLSQFERVAYNSVEEGLSLSVQSTFRRLDMGEAGGRFVLLDRDSVGDLIKRLQAHKSPNVVVIDSIQFWEMNFATYKRLKALFPRKLFIYISHVESGQPAGAVARKIWRDASISFRVDRFKAFPQGRYGGGEPVVNSEERAAELWEMQ
jgi:hypothetical protein